MKKCIVVSCIVALFIGIVCIPASANVVTKESGFEGPGWNYRVFGKISTYEILENNGTEYIHARAVYMFGLFWNVSTQFPNLGIPTCFFNQYFNLPLENSSIEIWPTPYSNYYYFQARGIL